MVGRDPEIRGVQLIAPIYDVGVVFLLSEIALSLFSDQMSRLEMEIFFAEKQEQIDISSHITLGM